MILKMFAEIIGKDLIQQCWNPDHTQGAIKILTTLTILEMSETPLSNVSESLLEQQMQFMNEVFRMMSAQHEQLRSRSSNKQTLKVKPEKFSGSVGTSFYSFIAQFENCSEINQWNEQEKILMLRSSLTGNALSILWDLGSDKDYSYEELVDMLKARYGLKGQTEAYRLQLRTRRQSRGESLSNLMQDIRKLMVLAYPGKMSELIEEIARDVFIETLYDRNLALQVLTKEPKSLDEAFQIAVKLHSYGELVYHSDHPKNVRNSDNLKCWEDVRTQKVHEETSNVEESTQPYTNPDEFKRMKDMIADLRKQMEEVKSNREQTNISNRDSAKKEDISFPKKINCYGCGKEGHRRFECPDKVSERSTYQGERTPADTSTRRQWNSRNTMKNNEPGERRKFSKRETKPKHVSSAGKGSLYANLRINGLMRKCLVDCGSEVSLIPMRMTEGLQRRESSRVLLAANNMPISSLGEVDVDIRVAGRVLPTTFLISDQIDSTILGLDWLSRHSCQINFESDILHIEDKRVQLHRSGNKHTNADAMSRRPCRQCHMCDNEDESYATEVKEINTITTAPVVDEVDMSVRPKQFQVGQKVLYYYPRRYRFRSPKWQKMYIGPYEVVKQLGPLNYVIKKCNGRHEIIAHIDKMKPYLGHLYEPQENTSYHDTPDNNIIGSPNTDTLNERLGTVDNPPTSTRSPRPARSRKFPEKYRDFVLFHVFEPNGHRLAKPAPTPRRCKFCEEVLNGKRAQTIHVQLVHRDILEMKKTQAQERERLQKQRGDVPGLAAV